MTTATTVTTRHSVLGCACNVPAGASFTVRFVDREVRMSHSLPVTHPWCLYWSCRLSPAANTLYSITRFSVIRYAPVPTACCARKLVVSTDDRVLIIIMLILWRSEL